MAFGSKTAAPLSQRGSSAVRGLVVLAGLTIAGSVVVMAQALLNSGTLAPLPGVPVPEPAALGDFVKNRTAAVALGKALFWDQNLGSDGRSACASCHFSAGADNRIKNQIDPGLAHVDPAIGSVFNRVRSGAAGGPNYTLRESDFPTYVLQDVNDRNSAIVFESNDVIGSQGVFFAAFDANGKAARFGGLLADLQSTLPLLPGQTAQQPVGTFVTGVLNTGLVGNVLTGLTSTLTQVTAPLGLALPGGRLGKDVCDLSMDTVFSVHGTNTRRVTGRNAPTTINAIFNHRSFWDGRASNVFNGSSPFGDRDPDAGIWVPGAGGLVKQRISLENSSAASQAVGPVNSEFEMSCAGRMFPNAAKRMLPIHALEKQIVAADDSVLGPLRPSLLGLVTLSPGLNITYAELVKRAFHDKFWANTTPVAIGGDRYTQMEANFALFFGLAIQMYEATLVSDQTPLDDYLRGNANALTVQEKRGLEVFKGKGQCIACHNGPQLTNAATPRTQSKEFVERMLMGDHQPALYDGGFYNIGVRPTVDDIGLGALDPWGNPLSFSRQYQNKLAGGKTVDRFSVDTCKFEIEPCTTPAADHREAVDGAFKTSGLRNIELTGPYFHNGSAATLAQVVEFYNRGGNTRGPIGHDTSGFGPNGSNLDADIKPLGLTVAEQADLVAFLKRPLTDARVAWERAPFDHPQLMIPNGQLGNESVVVANNSNQALDTLRELPAVGRSGRNTLQGPIKPFAAGLAR